MLEDKWSPLRYCPGLRIPSNKNPGSIPRILVTESSNPPYCTVHQDKVIKDSSGYSACMENLSSVGKGRNSPKPGAGPTDRFLKHCWTKNINPATQARCPTQIKTEVK
jgi:hypothetical protein